MAILGTNWKTNLGAVGVLLGSVGAVATGVADGTFHLDGETISGIVGAISAVWALFSAKDFNVTGGTVQQNNPYLPTPRTR